MMSQTSPAIWFDSWNNDLRDNDMKGGMDDADPTERILKNRDGLHYKGSYPALVAPLGVLSTDGKPAWMLSKINVTYKVCTDIPIESYLAAKVPMSTNRNVAGLFRDLKKIPGWRVWDGGQKPPSLMDGDVVAANNDVHQHAGIVKTGLVYDSVINLPGPTSARKYHTFRPSGSNDMVSVSRILFESILGIELYARWIMPTPP
ncbi:MAG TPA: hypothetical protein VGM06_20740 [Polyangiaceae bacterium]|jgi:hypothetical protein